MYTYTHPEGVRLQLERFSEKSDAVHAEATVTVDPGRWPELKSHHLHQARINLTSTITKNQLARALHDRHDTVDWHTIVEECAVLSIRRFRAGEPVLRIGNDPLTATRFLLEPLIVAGQVNILYGAGGSLKSYIAILAGLMVKNAFDHAGMRADLGEVLYLDWEWDDQEHNRRIRMIKNGLGPEMAEIEIDYRYCARPYLSEAVEIERIIGHHTTDLAIVDSMGAATNGRINDPDQQIPLFNSLRFTKVTPLIIDHVGKDEDRGIIGSIMKYNQGRNIWEARTSQEPGESEVTVGLYHKKANGMRLRKPFGLRFRFEDDTVHITQADLSKEGALAKNLPLTDQITTYILAERPSTSAEIALGIGAKESAVRDKLLERRDKDFTKLGDGKWATSGAREQEGHYW